MTGRIISFGVVGALLAVGMAGCTANTTNSATGPESAGAVVAAQPEPGTGVGGGVGDEMGGVLSGVAEAGKWIYYCTKSAQDPHADLCDDSTERKIDDLSFKVDELDKKIDDSFKRTTDLINLQLENQYKADVQANQTAIRKIVSQIPSSAGQLAEYLDCFHYASTVARGKSAEPCKLYDSAGHPTGTATPSMQQVQGPMLDDLWAQTVGTWGVPKGNIAGVSYPDQTVSFVQTIGEPIGPGSTTGGVLRSYVSLNQQIERAGQGSAVTSAPIAFLPPRLVVNQNEVTKYYLRMEEQYFSALQGALTVKEAALKNQLDNTTEKAEQDKIKLQIASIEANAGIDSEGKSNATGLNGIWEKGTSDTPPPLIQAETYALPPLKGDEYAYVRDGAGDIKRIHVMGSSDTKVLTDNEGYTPSYREWQGAASQVEASGSTWSKLQSAYAKSLPTGKTPAVWATNNDIIYQLKLHSVPMNKLGGKVVQPTIWTLDPTKSDVAVEKAKWSMHCPVRLWDSKPSIAAAATLEGSQTQHDNKNIKDPFTGPVTADVVYVKDWDLAPNKQHDRVSNFETRAVYDHDVINGAVPVYSLWDPNGTPPILVASGTGIWLDCASPLNEIKTAQEVTMLALDPAMITNSALQFFSQSSSPRAMQITTPPDAQKAGRLTLARAKKEALHRGKS